METMKGSIKIITGGNAEVVAGAAPNANQALPKIAF